MAFFILSYSKAVLITFLALSRPFFLSPTFTTGNLNIGDSIRLLLEFPIKRFAFFKKLR